MSKRRQQSRELLPTAIKLKKRKRILNNNEHEDSEVSNNEQRKKKCVHNGTYLGV